MGRGTDAVMRKSHPCQQGTPEQRLPVREVPCWAKSRPLDCTLPSYQQKQPRGSTFLARILQQILRVLSSQLSADCNSRSRFSLVRVPKWHTPLAAAVNSTWQTCNKYILNLKIMNIPLEYYQSLSLRPQQLFFPHGLAPPPLYLLFSFVEQL